MKEEGWEDLGLKLSAQKVAVTLNMARMCVDLKVAGLMLQIMGPLTPLRSHLSSVKCHTHTHTHNTTSAPRAAAAARKKKKKKRAPHTPHALQHTPSASAAHATEQVLQTVTHTHTNKQRNTYTDGKRGTNASMHARLQMAH